MPVKGEINIKNMSKKFLGLIYVTLFSLSWAIETIIGKFAINKGIEPLVFAYQILFGAVFILLIYIVITDSKKLKSIKLKTLPKLAIPGIIGSGLGNIATFYGLLYSTSINYGFLIKTTVIFTVVLAFIFLKEKITAEKSFFIFLLLIGAYLISTKGQLIYPAWGDLLILLSAFFYSARSVMSKPLLKIYSVEIVTLFGTLAGGLTIFILAPFIVPNFYQISNPLIIFFGSLFLFLTVFFMNKTIQTTGVSYLAMMSMMYSVFVVILGYMILDETMNIIQWAGGLLIITSVVLIQKSNIYKK